MKMNLGKQVSTVARATAFAIMGSCPFWSVPALAQPSALEPLPRPWYSIDLDSPTVAQNPTLNADDLFEVQNDGINPPQVAIDGGGLGLGISGDDLDGLSIADTLLAGPQLQPATFALVFSVSRSSVGAVDPLFVAFPFNAKQQATLGQAAGDEYLALALFDATGMVTASQSNNTLVGNQDDVGGVDGASLELLPLADPFTNVVGQSQDGLDAVVRTVAVSAGLAPTPLFFTLTSGSPSLETLPGEKSGADVYVDPDPNASGDELKYATADDLGLSDPDELDALHVMDNGDLVYNKDIDQVFLSLADGSPSLPMLGAGPADILTTTTTALGGPPLDIFASALDLGLCPEDDVTAIDFFPATDLVELVCRHGVRGAPTGDANGDCIIDPLDAGFIQSRFGCTVGGDGADCRAADANSDLIVDPLDVGFVLARLGDPVLGSGACCAAGGTCEVLPAEACIRSGRIYRGDDTICDSSICEITPDCSESND